MKKIKMLLILLMDLTINSASAEGILPTGNIKIGELIAQAECSKWQMIKKEDGVEISSRWLNFGDTLKTREVALHFTVDVIAEDLLHNIRSKSALIQWNCGVRELNIVQSSSSTWITDLVYDIPYPFSQQDLVTKNTIHKTDRDIVIDVNAEPDIVKIRDNVNRQRYYFGQWRITTLPSGETEVSFSAISFSKSNIPRFIRDPIVYGKLLSSFIKLKELSLNSDKQ